MTRASDAEPVLPPKAPARPDIDRDWQKLNPCLARLIEQLIAQARAAGLDVDLYEGRRTLQRQKLLYAIGRTVRGNIVTTADGVKRQSRHQQGLAADLLFRDRNENWIAPNHVPVAKWERLAAIGRGLGLVCGNDWKWRDRAHFEAPFFADLTPEETDLCRREGDE